MSKPCPECGGWHLVATDKPFLLAPIECPMCKPAATVSPLASEPHHDCEPVVFGDGEWARCSICGDAAFPVTLDAGYGLPKGSFALIATQQHAAELLTALRAYHAGEDSGELRALLSEEWDRSEMTAEERAKAIARFNARKGQQDEGASGAEPVAIVREARARAGDLQLSIERRRSMLASEYDIDDLLTIARVTLQDADNLALRIPALCDLAEEQARTIEHLKNIIYGLEKTSREAHQGCVARNATIAKLTSERAKDRAAFEKHVADLEGDKAHLNEDLANARATIDEMHDRLNKAAIVIQTQANAIVKMHALIEYAALNHDTDRLRDFLEIDT